MLEKLEEIKKRYLEVEQLLSLPESTSDMVLYKKLSKEYKDLKKIASKHEAYSGVIIGLEEAKNIFEKEKDEEFKEMAKKELEELNKKKLDLEHEIKTLLIPKDPNDEKNIILEIRSGTGGDEAAIFAGDLLRMYELYAEKMKWSFNVISYTQGTVGGYKEIVCGIEGEDVYGVMKYEAGTHRVQRVPDTETQGRVHTSAATVAVLPEAEEIDLKIDVSEIRKDTFRASGAGGQHVNKTESACTKTIY